MASQNTDEIAPKHRYFVVYKPVNMVSQFVSPDQVNLLGSLASDFPEGTHAIGRLDADSEGLLLLTTNKHITSLLFQGKSPHSRRYLVETNRRISAKDVTLIREGVNIRIIGGGWYTTKPCLAEIVDDPAKRFIMAGDANKYTPSGWLLITLTEGKFRQVRKMIAKLHLKVRRLVRISIEELTVKDMKAGQVVEIDEVDFFTKLNL